MKIDEDFVIQCQENLVQTLQEHGIDDNKISEIIESGYIKWNYALQFNEIKIEPCVLDTFYGNKYSGLIPIESFIKYITEGEIPKSQLITKYYTVKSLQEAEKILSTERHSKYYNYGKLSFRGQSKEYWLKRKVPNPFRKDNLNRERFIVPSFWRSCINNHNPASRPTNQNFMFNIFPPYNFAYNLIIKGGVFDKNDIYDASFSRDISLVEQHYGRKTIGLDITYDLSTAFFFASHQFAEVEGASKKYTYLPIKKGEHKGVVYCFVFRDPSVNKTEWMIKSVKAFQHIPPLRPLRQSCALPNFHSTEVNAAATDLDAVFFLDENFDTSGLPSKEYLFPDVKEDLFYGALLREKKRIMEIIEKEGDVNGISDVWDEFTEYKF